METLITYANQFVMKKRSCNNHNVTQNGFHKKYFIQLQKQTNAHGLSSEEKYILLI